MRLGLPAETPNWARGGIGQKPHDAFCFPACRYHHNEQHQHGEETFAKVYGVNLLKEALDLARNSPLEEIRNFVKELKL